MHARRLERLGARPTSSSWRTTVPNLTNRRKAPIALAIFVAMVGVAATGLANILTAPWPAAFLMLVTGCLKLHEAYEAVQSDVLMLIIGTIALGAAMTDSGAAELYARGFLSACSTGPAPMPCSWP